MKNLVYKFLLLLLVLLCLPVLLLVVTTPMSIHNQWVFGLSTVVLLLMLGQVSSKKARLAMALLTTLTATRYMFWRITDTVIVDLSIESLFSFGLLAAECYAWLVLALSFFQVAWPLERKVVPLTRDIRQWPTVDVYIPTYNESLEVVRDTVLAAQNLDYPAEKLNIYVLDDGKRGEFRAFSSQAGVGYIARSDNQHAKAGNLNNALKETHGELICIFDCDHITTRAFLQATVGSFESDVNLALVQTPHHFYSPDPFERNLVNGREVPHEGELFYGPIQKGNDFWNATFFCGSCAVIRRSALDEIGGFATETVTEDAHTALKLQRRGWSTAYIGIPMAAGLATERLALHIVQRARWARGMTQILRRDNPLLGRGLSLPQRLCYLSAMLHFQFPLVRFVFLTAPLAYLLFGLNVIEASPQLLAAYVLPHLFGAFYTNAKLVGEYRYTFWNEIYETVLTFHLLKPSLVTLFNPTRGKFDVTDKGGLLTKSFFDFSVTRPHLFVLALLVAGVIWSSVRLIWWDPLNNQLNALLFNVVWASISGLFLIAAVAVGNERKQIREYIRIDLKRPAILHLSGGYTLSTKTRNLSMGGIQLATLKSFPENTEIEFVEMALDGFPSIFPVQLIGSDTDHIRLSFHDLSISQRRQLVLLVMGRADAWIQKRRHPRDQPLRSMLTVIRAALGFFVLSWKDRRALPRSDSETGLGVQQDSSLDQPAPVSRPHRGISWATWIWRFTLIALIAVGILSTQHAWSQTGAPTDSIWPAQSGVTKSTDEALPDVGINTQGGLAFNAAPQSNSYELSILSPSSPAAAGPMRLIGNGAQAGLDFSLPSDEVVTDATLTLHLRYSDALLEGLSRLDLTLNGIETRVIELDRFTAQDLVVDINVPPELLVTYNTLLMSLSGQTLAQCNNILSENVWLEVLPGSSLSVETQLLPAFPGLDNLPSPFFDKADLRRLQLPIVMPDAPSETLLSASATLASYFAMNADFRGADFPVHSNLLPDEHALVIGTPEQMPLGVEFPSIDGPTLLQQANPNNSIYRLLIVTGRTEQEVSAAARYVAIRGDSLSGSIEQVSLPQIQPRMPYDAPKWQDLTQPVYLTDMVSDSALVGEGVRPPPQNFSFRLPPNMYLWPGDDITLEVGYEFPRGEWLSERQSRLEIGLNGVYLDSLPVQKRSFAMDIWRMLGNDARRERFTVRIPHEQLYGNNQLSFFFNMAVKLPEEGCELNLPDIIETRLSTDSRLNLTDVRHFSALPELSYWWSAGFPFTERADLSQTTLLLPSEPSHAEISTALGLVGRMGAASGYPGLALNVHKGLFLTPDMANQDVLVVADANHLEAGDINQQLAPFVIRDGALNVSPMNSSERFNLLAQARWGAGAERARRWLASRKAKQMVMGVISPLNAERSIVVATALAPEDLKALPTLMDQPNISRQAVGDLILMGQRDEVNAFQVAPRAPRGDMPWYHLVRWYAGQYILPMLLAMTLMILLVAGLIYRALHRRAERRMGDDNDLNDGE